MSNIYLKFQSEYHSEMIHKLRVMWHPTGEQRRMIYTVSVIKQTAKCPKMETFPTVSKQISNVWLNLGYRVTDFLCQIMFPKINWINLSEPTINALWYSIKACIRKINDSGVESNLSLDFRNFKHRPNGVKLGQTSLSMVL